MVALMAKKKFTPAPSTVRAGDDYSKPVDAFSRVDGETMRKLDELANDSGRTRSNLINLLIRQYVEQEYPKLERRRG